MLRRALLQSLLARAPALPAATLGVARAADAASGVAGSRPAAASTAATASASATGSTTAGQVSASVPASGGGSIAASAVVPRRLVFPADFGSHPDFRTEWWYVTGTLDAAGGAGKTGNTGDKGGAGRADGAAPYGFQVTFFRSRTDVAGDSPSRFAARQLVFAHAALTDPAAGRLRHDQRIARAGFGIAQAAEADTDVRLRGWTFRREPWPAAPGGHRYRTRIDAEPAGFAFDLAFDATQPVMLQGAGGVSRKGPDPAQATYYLSEPHLAVRGALVLDGRRREVTGRAWLDHEWSESLLHPDAAGWDWLGMNLDDGGALMAFRIRRSDGSALWAGGGFRPAGGAAVQAFAADDVRFTPLRRWTSPITRAVYPVDWRIDTPAGRFEVRARLDAQELDSRGSTGAIYWEGLSDLFDAASGRRVGRGYLELTGYAATLRMG